MFGLHSMLGNGFYELVYFSVILLFIGFVIAVFSTDPYKPINTGTILGGIVFFAGVGLLLFTGYEHSVDSKELVPAAWVKALPPAEARMMHAYTESTQKPLTARRFLKLEHAFKKYQIHAAISGAETSSTNEADGPSEKTPTALQSQLDATSTY